MDVSAVIWTVDWPTHGTVGTFISGFKAWFRVRVSEADVHICFDRYRDYSTKSTTRSSRAAATRVHLTSCTLKHHEQYLQQVTQHHRVVVTGDDAVPTQVSKGRKIPRLDIDTTQEESDLIITQQAIHLAKEDGESRVCVLCDDTDVFALLVYFFSREQHQSSMTMESPIHDRSCIDIKETARKHDAIISAILPLHALTGCDSVAATYGLGKTTLGNHCGTQRIHVGPSWSTDGTH